MQTHVHFAQAPGAIENRDSSMIIIVIKSLFFIYNLSSKIVSEPLLVKIEYKMWLSNSNNYTKRNVSFDIDNKFNGLLRSFFSSPKTLQKLVVL